MSSLFHLSAKEINSCLRYVAELRVNGMDWDQIAQELKRPLQEVRQFVYQHEEVFRLYLKKARQEQKNHCYDTAFEVLRQHSQSKNEKVSLSAATTLIRLKISEDRLRMKKLQEKMREKGKENKPIPPTKEVNQPVCSPQEQPLQPISSPSMKQTPPANLPSVSANITLSETRRDKVTA
jgi:hypothetical protein